VLAGLAALEDRDDAALEAVAARVLEREEDEGDDL